MNKIRKLFVSIAKLPEQLNKLSLPAVILIASVVLGGFFYASQVNKQGSIEKQQRIELEAKERQDKIDYSAKRKSDCLDIYKTEGAKWNNVNGWRYDDSKDVCYIQYKQTPKKTNAECDKEYKGADGKVLPIFFSDWLLCYDGLFEKSF